MLPLHLIIIFLKKLKFFLPNKISGSFKSVDKIAPFSKYSSSENALFELGCK
jgi:hypothetical protein